MVLLSMDSISILMISVIIAGRESNDDGHMSAPHLSAAKVVVPPALLLKEMSRHLAPLIDQIVQFKCESKALAAASGPIATQAHIR